jgi:hypothetical protein
MVAGASPAPISGTHDAMPLRIIAAALFLIWLALVLMGKGGFVHLLFFNALGVAFIEALRVYRTNLRFHERSADQTPERSSAS